jgi:flagellar motor switch protein FliG
VKVERVLERKLSTLVTQDFTTAGGVKAIVEVLNRVDRTTEKSIVETLEVDNPELAEEIKRLMFVFEDIVQLDDRSLQMVLREVDTKGPVAGTQGYAKGSCRQGIQEYVEACCRYAA